jgi:Domain of unknown function (DUF4276)
MNCCPVLLEGWSDRPVVKALLERYFGLTEETHFSLHHHRGKGQLPDDLLGPPLRGREGLLDQLPSKLRGMSHRTLVVVLMDLDDHDLRQQKKNLERMLQKLPKRPQHVLFGFAIEETESWFIADHEAVLKAFPKVKIRLLQAIAPDAIVGAAENLAKALGSKTCTGADKNAWAESIAPHLDFNHPRSPSLQQWIADLSQAFSLMGWPEVMAVPAIGQEFPKKV